jgi:hypothetical protein
MEEVRAMDKDFTLSYDTTYDERGWDDENYEDYDEDDETFYYETMDWMMDDEREMYRD